MVETRSAKKRKSDGGRGDDGGENLWSSAGLPQPTATASAQMRKEELVLHSQGGDGGYVEISPSNTLSDVRRLILEHFDPEQLPLARSEGGEKDEPEQSDAQFAFRVNGVRVSTKQEFLKNAFELWESKAKVELVPRKRRTIAAPEDDDRRKVARVGTVTPFEPSGDDREDGDESTVTEKDYKATGDGLYSAAGDGLYSDTTEEPSEARGDEETNGGKDQEKDGKKRKNNAGNLPAEVEVQVIGVQTLEQSLAHQKGEAEEDGDILDLTSEMEEEPSSKPGPAARVKLERKLSFGSTESDEIVAIADVQQKFRSSGIFDDLKIGPNTRFNNLRLYTVQYHGPEYGYVMVACNGRVILKTLLPHENGTVRGSPPNVGSIIVGLNGYLIPYRACFVEVLEAMKRMMKKPPVTVMFAEDEDFTSMFAEDSLLNAPDRPVRPSKPTTATRKTTCCSSSYQSQVQIPPDHTPTWGDILPTSRCRRQR